MAPPVFISPAFYHLPPLSGPDVCSTAAIIIGLCGFPCRFLFFVFFEISFVINRLYAGPLYICRSTSWTRLWQLLTPSSRLTRITRRWSRTWSTTGWWQEFRRRTLKIWRPGDIWWIGTSELTTVSIVQRSLKSLRQHISLEVKTIFTSINIVIDCVIAAFRSNRMSNRIVNSVKGSLINLCII